MEKRRNKRTKMSEIIIKKYLKKNFVTSKIYIYIYIIYIYVDLLGREFLRWPSEN